MEFYLTFMGSDFIAEVDLTIHSYGEPESGRFGPPEHYDPGSGPDFAINSIHLREDRPGKPGPAFLATGALFDLLSTSRQLDDSIIEHISEMDPLDRWEYDEDVYREDRDYSDLPDWD